jgi:protein arginine kinase
MSETWYTSPLTDEGQIISSRIRLARNLKNYPFHQKLSKESAHSMVQETYGAFCVNTLFHAPIDIAGISEIEQNVFLEKHIVSPEFLKSNQPRGLLLTEDANASIMVNEEDHIRIQTISAGDGLDESLELADYMDDFIEQKLEYAFHTEYGYLTACPTNAGTGLRASYMIHLPILEKTNQLNNLLPAISKFGITLRGIHGEGTESMGGIYQISNQVTLGKSEPEIIHALKNVTKNIIEKENMLCKTVLKQRKSDIENNVYRAYGILAYSRKINTKEAMDLLSEIRLGYLTGLLALPKPEKRIYQIMMEIQAGHLQRVAGGELDEKARDYARADYLRGLFRKEHP